jgi:hypothetical protein
MRVFLADTVCRAQLRYVAAPQHRLHRLLPHHYERLSSKAGNYVKTVTSGIMKNVPTLLVLSSWIK